MSFEDADIVEALQALESEIPDGYFDDFSRKVAARLEVDSMQQSDVNAGGPVSGLDDSWVAAGAAPEQSKKTDRDENSGLHEIRELATTAKRRISSRMSSQGDAEEALLASSSGLHAIVLPKPGKEAKGEVVSLPTAEERAAAVATPEPEPKAGIPAALWAAVGTLAIAAAIVFFVVRSGASEDGADSKVAANTGASSAEVADKAAGAAAAPEPAADPATADPAVEGLGDSDGAGAPPPPAGDSPDAPAVVDNADDDASGESAKPERAAAGVAAATRKSARAEKMKKQREPRAKAKEAKTEKKSAKDAPKDDAKKPAKAKTGAKADMGDLLDSVTGGVEEEAEEKKQKKPTKKALDRRDVSKAMGRIRSRAGACHEKEGATGQVKIRFTVAPSGKVSSAKPTGKFAGTPTGSCVASAVKRAKFPAFDGAPTTFTFPFLLSQ